MNNMVKIVAWIVVAVIILSGAYYWYQSRNAAPPVVPPGTPAATTSQPAAETLPSGTSTSDASLKEDLSSVDQEMSGMNGDATSIDQGLNDQQLPQ